jgi:hypothetical protein
MTLEAVVPLYPAHRAVNYLKQGARRSLQIEQRMKSIVHVRSSVDVCSELRSCMRLQKEQRRER